MQWNHWVIAGLGGWLVLSPWILGYSSLNIAMWNSILVGGLIGVFAMWNFVPPEE